jgi:hypothetical protein
MDAFAGPGIVADNENEDPDRDQRVNEPTKQRRRDVQQDANNRSYYLRGKNSLGQMRLD